MLGVLTLGRGPISLKRVQKLPFTCFGTFYDYISIKQVGRLRHDRRNHNGNPLIGNGRFTNLSFFLVKPHPLPHLKI
jgi:hypothetical protein